jgi:heat shock protein HtpX
MGSALHGAGAAALVPWSTMSTTTMSIATRARTWLFVAGLTGLLIAAGVLVGGAFLYVFVALAVLMNVVGYWCSDRIALAASRAQPLAESDGPELHADVAELSARAGIPVPRLYVIAAEQPNAFATGRSPARSAVAVTEGLLAHMPREQVRGVIAHELAHIRNRDVLVSSIAAMIAGSISAVANVLQFTFLFGGDDEDSGALGLVGTLALLILAPIAATLLQLAVSRQREYLADATAARFLGGGRSLADALETLEQGTRAAPIAVNPAFASLYIANPLPRIGVAGLFSTHPPISDRIRRLRGFDGSPAPEIG